MKIKWSSMALEAYKQAGVDLTAAGLKPLREIRDADCGTVLTIWGGTRTIIMQTWPDTGDVCFYRAVELAEAIA